MSLMFISNQCHIFYNFATITLQFGAMYEQEGEEMLDPFLEEEFTIHYPLKNNTNTNPSPKSDLDHIRDISRRCDQLSTAVLMNKIQQFSESILDLINQNFNSGEKKMGQKQKLIFPITVRKNQQGDLADFIKKIIEKIQTIGEEEDDGDDRRSQNSRNFVFKKSRKINITKGDETQVRKIALKLHQRYKGIYVQKDLMIYCSTKITTLQPANTYILEEGLYQCNCLLLLPTLSHFDLYNSYSNSKIQVIPIHLYNHKELFCELFYKMIYDDKIMAYLPAESVSLVSDFDLYPISYREGARRLIFCIQKMLYVHHQKNIKLEYINIKQLFDLIEDAMRRTFKIFFQGQTTDKAILNILGKDFYFNPFDRFLNKIDHFRYHGGEMKSEEELMKSFRERLHRHLQKSQHLLKYADFINPTKADKKIRKHDKDLNRFGIDYISSENQQKNFIQLNLTKIIKMHTAKIRDQAQKVTWEEINFTERIRPMIPYDIHESVKKSKVHGELLDYIEAQFSLPLARIIQNFCGTDQVNMTYGQLIYYLKDLELYGLIDIVYKSLTPRVSPCFFPKAKYASKKV